MCAVDDLEPPTVFRVVYPRARVRHRCCECRRSVRPGEVYRRVTGLWDGSWSTFTTCGHCAQVARWMETMCGGYVFGSLLEELVEHWDEGHRSVAFGRLIVGVRRRWHDGGDPVPSGVSELAWAMAGRLVS